jgi:hypothetical protein
MTVVNVMVVMRVMLMVMVHVMPMILLQTVKLHSVLPM